VVPRRRRARTLSKPRRSMPAVSSIHLDARPNPSAVRPKVDDNPKTSIYFLKHVLIVVNYCCNIETMRFGDSCI
jgi:hypothetical protein